MREGQLARLRRRRHRRADQKITERILGTYAEISRNRPEGGLPEIRFRPIGTWMLSGRPEGLTDAIRGAYALTPEGKGIH